MDANLFSTLVSAGLIGLVVMVFVAFSALGLLRAEVEEALSGDLLVARLEAPRRAPPKSQVRPELSRASFMVK